jgi:hypothetical protein
MQVSQDEPACICSANQLDVFAQGLGNTTIFCGDGINDLAALSAADVGMSIGATDAVIAAALSTPQGSVAGKSSLKLHGMALLSCLFTVRHT